MSEGAVDFSQIRGDWKFHIDYLSNAIEQTLKRANKDWGQLGDDGDIDAAVKLVNERWEELKANANDKGTIPTTDGRLEAFIEAVNATKSLCDAYEDRNDSQQAEEFAEGCRQLRSFSPDLEMMRDQRPEGF